MTHKRGLYKKTLKKISKRGLYKKRTLPSKGLTPQRRVLKAGHKVALKASINRGRLCNRPTHKKILKMWLYKIYLKMTYNKKKIL